MWLLNSKTSQLKSFISDDEIPGYVILSHTWGEEEVTFQHWQAAHSHDSQFAAFPDDWRQRNLDNLQRMRGYEKIARCQETALENGVEWVWVDTCCIDKQSSAELSEAINSMYRWYNQSLICYAYLQDARVLDEIKTSRWFQRGWTLQELIAPKTVIFFNQDWQFLGRKDDLGDELEAITGIDAAVLRGGSFEQASIAKRMSWAARRSTSRTEDTAYSLLGIFGINMPLIYGEGENAFIRLQEEILRRNPNDHSLFAWGEHVHLDLPYGNNLAERIQALTLSAGDFPMATDLHGLLASSPKDFLHSKDIISSQDSDTFRKPLAQANPRICQNYVLSLPAQTFTHYTTTAGNTGVDLQRK
ncbi:hypothetical protein PG988_006481 [Apiospora saccharicola]